MDNYQNSPWVSSRIIKFAGILLRLIGFVLVGNVLAILLVSLIWQISPDEIGLKISNAGADDKFLILFAQGLNQLFSFIILPVLYIHYFAPSLREIFNFPKKNWGAFTGLAIIILLASIPLVNWLIAWNQSIHFPDIWGIRTWMQEKELQVKNLTDIIAYYNTPGEFFIGLLVIAILPAIGEELLFRGVIQNELADVFKKPQLSIWIAGFIFSFLHFQFYGFFPRMFLGVVFGYLYYWSGSLYISMSVHFLNNLITFILLNLYKQKIITTDPESAESLPAISIIISFFIFVLLLLAFKRLSKNERDL